MKRNFVLRESPYKDVDGDPQQYAAEIGCGGGIIPTVNHMLRKAKETGAKIETIFDNILIEVEPHSNPADVMRAYSTAQYHPFERLIRAAQ